MRARLAPLLALLFFVAACTLVVAEPWFPGSPKYAIVAMALSNAAILWAYFSLTDGGPAPHGSHAAPPRRRNR